MTGAALHQALAYAARGWPVFPCQPGQKIPATMHGFRDATTDPDQITAWFTRHPGYNLAIATGAPGPDVLDVDVHGPAGNGYPALRRLRGAGLLDGAAAHVRTPSGGLHAYFTGTTQRSGHLPCRHLDFRSAGGYILAPPSQIGGRPYQLLQATGRHGHLDWNAVIRLLDPARQQHRPGLSPAPRRDVGPLACWVAAQPEGNRNAGLFWAANRVLEADPAADLSPLAAAARQAGLGDAEIKRTLDSARRTGQAGLNRPVTRLRRRTEMSINTPVGTGQSQADPPHPATGPSAARAHVHRLRQDGATYAGIATAAGLTPATVSGLATGRRRPTRGTTAAVLSVTSQAPPRGRIDAGGTRLRLRALHVMGHSTARIARTLGASEKTIRKLLRGDAKTISPALRDEITDLYDAWWDKRAPDRTRFQRGTATRARKRAIAGNWCAGAALDDDLLDVPGYRPRQGWKPATGTGVAPEICPRARRRRARR